MTTTHTPRRLLLPEAPSDDFDFHTHNLMAPPGKALVCLPPEVLLHPEAFTARRGVMYSVGLHPWQTDTPLLSRQLLDRLPAWLAHPQVVAVGECGLDALRGADLKVQTEYLTEQLAWAEEYGLPVVLHVVRAFDRVLQLRKRLRPHTPWTVHGFRGKPALAQQLLRAGFDLSFGKRYNPEAYALTPPEHRRHETDDAADAVARFEAFGK